MHVGVEDIKGSVVTSTLDKEVSVSILHKFTCDVNDGSMVISILSDKGTLDIGESASKLHK